MKTQLSKPWRPSLATQSMNPTLLSQTLFLRSLLKLKLSKIRLMSFQLSRTHLPSSVTRILYTEKDVLARSPAPIFVKGTWFNSHFDLSISDGLNAWLCNATEEEASDRAAQWDQPVSEYINLAERYLGFQMPGSIYTFTDAGDAYKRLSWTFEKEGTKLEWQWKCRPAPNSKEITAGLLDFLMDENIKLSVVTLNNYTLD
ncbi:hypothetical protein LWI29_030342 [Acer saccharum]|uniref:XRCC4 N-terminal domain-containing protein n=1 Tax=Acer saccharum TaxID=4024 RepID=A0AA39W9A4_ACESA|nr:hypothetical protein LWI29_030342 [Acer saccharum]